MLLVFSLTSSIALADQETVGYSVRAIIPGNQIAKEQTYFDLWMEPDQVQEIEVEIFNSTNEDAEIDVYITNPLTNRNGIIDYTNIDVEIDESLRVPMTEIATVGENPVKVKAGTSQIVPIQLNMPLEEFDGIILGGIYFEKRLQKEAKEKSLQLTNKYAYVLGLKLTETDAEIEPDLHLKSVRPDLVNYRTAVIAEIQNHAPVIVRDLSITAKVYNEKGQEVNGKDVEGYEMAPNSTMDFVIEWHNKALKPGKYTLKMHAKSGAGKWDWEKEFEIEEKEAEDLNEDAVAIETDFTWYIIGGFLIVILILLIIIFTLLRKNKK